MGPAGLDKLAYSGHHFVAMDSCGAVHCHRISYASVGTDFGNSHRCAANIDGDDRSIGAGVAHDTSKTSCGRPVIVDAPEGITFAVENPTKFSVQGIDKQVVGETAANIRKIRKPEPYKGKGVRYEGENVRRKVGKAGK